VERIERDLFCAARGAQNARGEHRTGRSLSIRRSRLDSLIVADRVRVVRRLQEMLAFALRGSEARNVDVTGPESRLGVFKRELESKSIPADGLSANGAADAGSGSAPNAFRVLSRKQPSADRVSGPVT